MQGLSSRPLILNASSNLSSETESEGTGLLNKVAPRLGALNIQGPSEGDSGRQFLLESSTVWFFYSHTCMEFNRWTAARNQVKLGAGYLPQQE